MTYRETLHRGEFNVDPSFVDLADRCPTPPGMDRVVEWVLDERGSPIAHRVSAPARWAREADGWNRLQRAELNLLGEEEMLRLVAEAKPEYDRLKAEVGPMEAYEYAHKIGLTF